MLATDKNVVWALRSSARIEERQDFMSVIDIIT